MTKSPPIASFALFSLSSDWECSVVEHVLWLYVPDGFLLTEKASVIDTYSSNSNVCVTSILSIVWTDKCQIDFRFCRREDYFTSSEVHSLRSADDLQLTTDEILMTDR